MKKWVVFIVLLLLLFRSYSQLQINIQLPPSGVVQKTQLWNMLVTNTGKISVPASVNLLMTTQSGQQVLSARSITYNFPPGNTQLNAANLAPIQYSVLTGDWIIDASQNGFLPPGIFQICFTLAPEAGVHVVPVEQCNIINIEPLSPPQLISPENMALIDSMEIPQFIWIPPAPMNLFSNLQYDLYLVQVDSFQTAAEAIQMNIPILYQQNIPGTNLLYPASAAQLQQDVKYAWQVTARNNLSPVSASETWVFSLKKSTIAKKDTSDLPFVRLRKNEESGYAISAGKLKFAYTNETADSTWNINVYDISSRKPENVSFSMDSISLKRGLNLVQMDLMGNARFINKHLYLLELHNSRNEVWRLKFEFLREGN
jgi:hypothetical protein